MKNAKKDTIQIFLVTLIEKFKVYNLIETHTRNEELLGLFDSINWDYFEL